MAKIKSVFVCQNCGVSRPKWEGQCRDCGAWNSLVEERDIKPAASGRSWTVKGGSKSEQTDGLRRLDETQSLQISTDRWVTGLSELDRVLGGGLVPGSYILLGGDPGIGKSTLLMQVAGQLAGQKKKVIYISGEESIEQTTLRARRLGVSSKGPGPESNQSLDLSFGSENRLPLIVDMVARENPDVLIVDSIQTVYLPDLQSAPGTVSQVRECAAELMSIAKGHRVAVFLVGHITKDGSIAGPKTLEHMVDTVLHFEGDAHHQFRLLRAQKNRFGPTNELGVFQMSGEGLEQVENPSEIFLAERGQTLIGSAVFPAMEGTRPLLCEIQSLTTTTYMASPRRTALGVDGNRVHVLAAVLDKHLGQDFSRHDVFVSVVGGLRVSEPAADVACAAAMLSTLHDRSLDARTVFFGEVGLTGEIRAATYATDRLREATKLGFQTAVLPAGNKKHLAKFLEKGPLTVHWVSHVDDLNTVILSSASGTIKKPAAVKTSAAKTSAPPPSPSA
jgi:DNA repair protein RadA/Sms